MYDREHTIGHAFFSPLKEDPSIDRLASIFEKSVIPLLQEYFYEDYSKIQLVLGDDGKQKEEEPLGFLGDIVIVGADRDPMNTSQFPTNHTCPTSKRWHRLP